MFIDFGDGKRQSIEDHSRFVDTLNGVGRDAWELCTSVAENEAVMLVFKRPFTEEDKPLKPGTLFLG